MKLALRAQPLSLSAKLTLLVALLSLVTVTVATVALTALGSSRMYADLNSKSINYAHLLQKQLEPVVAFDDRLTAREVFASMALDSELDGVAVYAQRGALIEGLGKHPQSLATTETLNPGADHVIATANIRSREGPAGRLYVSLSTRQIEREQLRAAWTAAAIAATIILLAVVMALQVSRKVTRRLARIATVAQGVAAGNFAQARIEPGAEDEIGSLAQAFNFMVAEVNRLFEERRQLALTEQERLGHLVDERTYELQQSREQFRLIVEGTNAIPFTLDLGSGCFTYVGPQAFARLGFDEQQWKQADFIDMLLPRDSNHDARQRIDQSGSDSFEFESTLPTPDGRSVELRWVINCETVAGATLLRGLLLDISEQRQLEQGLAQAQKLESVGRLAAGVAHEINTPVQFISDNVFFVREAMRDVAGVVASYRALQQAVQDGGDVAASASAASEAERAIDLDYVMDNVPTTLDSAIEGLERIATIVRSMKEFAHPDSKEKSATDLNRAIQSTLVIANNEYKYVAEVETEFGELPAVRCFAGEVNQVILNLLVNAAHAIGDVVKDTPDKGRLTVCTRLDGAEVEIAISDTGGGIPTAIRAKIFDPFFTTKEVGKGTGQGLAIARSVIVDKHGGSLHFETELGKGTTFYIRLPVGGQDDASVREEVAA